jgi:hypothetical protein
LPEGERVMATRLKLKPGQRGTKKFDEMYGDALVYVRYRYDEGTCTRVKTIEIVVETKAWTPPPPKFTADEIEPVRNVLQEVSQGIWWEMGPGREIMVHPVWQDKRDAFGKAYSIRCIRGVQTRKAYDIRCLISAPHREKHIILDAIEAYNIRCKHIILDACIYY